MAAIKYKTDDGNFTIPLYETEKAGVTNILAQIDGKDYYAPLTTSLTQATASALRIKQDDSTYAFITKLKLTASKYKMSDIYPDTYRTMTEIPDELEYSSLQSYAGMFRGCKALTKVPDMDTSNATIMMDMFEDCGLSSVPELDTSGVRSFNEMFYGCKNLPAEFPWTIDLFSLYEADGSIYSGLNDMFRNSSVTKVRFKNVKEELKSQITSQLLKSDDSLNVEFEGNGISLTDKRHKMSELYASTYTSITEIPDTLDTSNLNSTIQMFYCCYKLETVPEINTSKIKNMMEMFYNCKKLPAEFPWIIDCSSVSSASSLRDMFTASSVTKVKLKNVKEGIKSQITSQLLKGNNTLTIEFCELPKTIVYQFPFEIGDICLEQKLDRFDVSAVSKSIKSWTVSGKGVANLKIKTPANNGNKVRATFLISYMTYSGYSDVAIMGSTTDYVSSDVYDIRYNRTVDFYKLYRKNLNNGDFEVLPNTLSSGGEKKSVKRVVVLDDDSIYFLTLLIQKHGNLSEDKPYLQLNSITLERL